MPNPATDPHLFDAYVPPTLMPRGTIADLGLDVLVSQWPNDVLTIALRDGRANTSAAWSPQIALTLNPTGLPMPTYAVLGDDHDRGHIDGPGVLFVGACRRCRELVGA